MKTREIGAWTLETEDGVTRARLGEGPPIELDGLGDPDALSEWDEGDYEHALASWPVRYLLSSEDGRASWEVPNVMAGDWVARWYDADGAIGEPVEDWIDGGDIAFAAPEGASGRLFLYLRRLGR